MSQQAFFFDGTRCSGCKTCMFACKDAYDLDVGTAYRRVFEYTGGDTVRNGDGTFGSTCFSYNVSVACNHCDDPVCVRVCPTEAMHKDEQTGLVSVNDRHCIGCGYCHLSCPYSAPRVDRVKGHSVKCDGCIERVAAGEKPVCVEACPARALDFGPLGEITLVLFTTLAPSGVVAFICMGLPVLGRGASVVLRQRLNVFLGLPLVVAMVGLVASATHLGNPANALYVFLGVGRSPLSTEVFCAVVFLALAGLYWLYNFVEHPKPQLQRAWLVLAMLAGAVFVAAVGCAYAADTIVSWYTVYVPLNLMLNALVGGPILAIAGLRAAGYEPVEGRMGRALTMVAAAALAVNVVTFGMQGADLASIENSYLTAAELVPSYGLMVCAFGVLGMAGIGLDAVELWPRRVRLSVGRAAGAAVLVLAGIFVMRFAFYMMHMTVGLGV